MRRVITGLCTIGLLSGACGCAPTDDPVGSEVVLQTLSLTPSVNDLAPGATTQFVVTGQWSDGGTGTPTVEYTATGGTISPSGLYTAGAVVGAFRAIAHHVGGTLADTSVINITAVPPPATILLQEDFEDDNAAARGWYDYTAFTTTTAQHLPGGSTRSLEWSWAAGAMLPGFAGTARFAIAPTSQLYVSYWVKYSANWVGSGQPYHPHEFTITTTENDQWVGPASTRLTTYIEHNYQNGGIPVIGTSDAQNIDATKIGVDLTSVSENRSTAGCNGNSDGIPTDCFLNSPGVYRNGKLVRTAGNATAFKPTAGPGYKGDWHHVEVLFRMNTVTGGVANMDGLAQYWFDGQLLIDRQNFLFRTGARASMQWRYFILGPYIGDGAPVAQTAWIDNLVLMTAKP